MTLLINLYGGPGTGKSTCCAGLFFKFKTLDYNCEMAREYAKGKVWENSLDVLKDQPYVFGKQLHKFKILCDKVDVIITDSPLLLSLYYGDKETESFKNFVLGEHNKFNSINIFLNRVKKFNPSGRLQSEEESKNIDVKVKEILDKNNIKYYIFDGTREAVNEIFYFLKLGGHLDVKLNMPIVSSSELNSNGDIFPIENLDRYFVEHIYKKNLNNKKFGK